MDFKVGVFDSGIGGLSVVREIKRLMPGQPLIYFGDTARTPYGPKSLEILRRYALQDAKFLIQQGASLVVIACHSAASAATGLLESELAVPVFEVVTPSVAQAITLTRNFRIGVIGTRATISSRIYDRLIPERLKNVRVFGRACPLLVPLVEEGWINNRETRMIVKRYLRPLREKQIDTLVLGCTHYPLLKRVIMEKAGKRVKIVDPSEEVARAVHGFLKGKGLLAEGSGDNDRFFVSDLTSNTQTIVERFMGKGIKLEKAVFS